MIDETRLFLETERRLGRYTVVILQHASQGWAPSVMQLDAVVTNYRLLLRPFRKKYPPASLPSHYIRGIDLTRQGQYHCVAIELVTSHRLYLSLSTGKLENLHEDLCAMKTPPPRFRFDDKVAMYDIQRLITFFGREPLPSTSG